MAQFWAGKGLIVTQLLRVFALVLFSLFIAASAVEAQQVSGFVELWNAVSKTGTVPEVNVYVHGPIKGKFRWNSWSLMTADWSEALVGIAYAPADWVELSASVGIESDDDPLRKGASVFLSKGRCSLLSIHENGGSGYWYRYVGSCGVTETIEAGVNSIRFFGTGPYFSKSFGKISLWGAYAVGDNKGILSARLSF